MNEAVIFVIMFTLAMIFHSSPAANIIFSFGYSISAFDVIRDEFAYFKKNEYRQWSVVAALPIYSFIGGLSGGSSALAWTFLAVVLILLCLERSGLFLDSLDPGVAIFGILSAVYGSTSETVFGVITAMVIGGIYNFKRAKGSLTVDQFMIFWGCYLCGMLTGFWIQTIDNLVLRNILCSAAVSGGAIVIKKLKVLSPFMA